METLESIFCSLKKIPLVYAAKAVILEMASDFFVKKKGGEEKKGSL